MSIEGTKIGIQKVHYRKKEQVYCFAPRPTYFERRTTTFPMEVTCLRCAAAMLRAEVLTEVEKEHCMAVWGTYGYAAKRKANREPNTRVLKIPIRYGVES